MVTKLLPLSRIEDINYPPHHNIISQYNHPYHTELRRAHSEKRIFRRQIDLQIGQLRFPHIMDRWPPSISNQKWDPSRITKMPPTNNMNNQARATSKKKQIPKPPCKISSKAISVMTCTLLIPTIAMIWPQTTKTNNKKRICTKTITLNSRNELENINKINMAIRKSRLIIQWVDMKEIVIHPFDRKGIRSNRRNRRHPSVRTILSSIKIKESSRRRIC